MNEISELKWNDLVSPTMTPDDYLKGYHEKIDLNYRTYIPKENVLEKIEKILKKKNEKLKIVALGADWCPDCNRNVPRIIKIIKTMKSEDIDLRILYGIMLDGLHKEGLKIWHKTRSPPEALDPKFDLKKIPTFYFFKENNDLLGIIVENPKWESTLEEDILEILESEF
ncbi:MAG: thioredoxin family protein [Candidatus Heimdallarchaeota archaeon]